jgi:diguanylate cyclase (GGDEF)-like protein/PAS domain S-box-containing protein
MLLLVIVSVCVAGGLVGVRTTDTARVALRDSALAQSLAAADLATAHVHEWIGGAQTGVRDLASRSVIRLAAEDADYPTLQGELQQWLPLHPRLDNVSIFDLDGTLLVAGKGTQAGSGQVSIADRPYFQRVLRTQAPAQSGPGTSRLTGRPTAPYAVPIKSDAGELQAVLVAGIDLGPFADTLGRQEDITLVDLDSGLVVSAPDPWQILQPLPLDPGVLRRLEADGRGTLEVSPTADQPARLVAFALVPDLRWGVLVQQPTSQAFAAVDGMVQQNVVLVSLALVLAASLGTFWAWRLTRPLRILRATADAMAAGNLNRRTGLTQRDEIGDLSRAFDRMADRLGTTIAELEAAVALAEEREGRIRAVVNRVADGILVVDPNGRIASCNPAAERMFSYSSGLLGLDASQLLHGELLRPRQDRRPASGAWVTVGRRQDGREFAVELAQSTVRVDGAEHSILVVRDTTERRRFEEQLRYQAFHDGLTGLPNRLLFRDRLNGALSRSERQRRSVAVLFLDLDDFKLVNDSLGHAAGDVLLVEVARRLQACARASDTVARLGGDEFALLLEEQAAPLEAEVLATRIARALREPFTIQGHDVFTTVSVGVAMSRPELHEPERLLREADLALYQAKAQGKSCWAVFDHALEARAVRRLALESDLRRALQREEFRLFFQPSVSLGDGRILGVEALVRWQHPERGLVEPASFLPAAEEAGLIVPIGRWVLAEACRRVREWQTSHLGSEPEAFVQGLGLAINVSAQEFRSPDLIENVRRALQDSGLEPSLLTLEISEQCLMRDLEAAADRLRDLKGLGVRLAIDDFGTGYGSLAHVRSLPVDVLKIDGSFVRALSADPQNAAIARGVIGLAQALAITVTAEGVETPHQRTLLRDLGCDEAQGFLFGAPMAWDEVRVFVEGAGSGHAETAQPEERAA